MERLHAARDWLAENGMSIAVNAAGIGGIASITYGVAEIYRPAGFITGGIIVLSIVLLLAWRSK